MDFRVKRLLSFGVGDERVTTVDYSVYVYTNDASNRRATIVKSGSAYASPVTETYTYDVRNELISADDVSYAYDDIGNRTIAEGKTYTANNLNQYTAIDDFVPQYDADGNQTLIKTETGIWSVTYNAENRPIRWQSGDTVITMSFDRMGRRVDYQETRAGQVATHFRFVYDNFLCVQRLNAANGNAVRTEFVWDPTEPIATRPLIMRAKNWDLNLFYTHDGNKNVSEVFYHALQNGIAAHYDYAPFGAITRTSSATRVTNRDILSENPFRFSSEYHDDVLALTYYNYRHYHPLVGRWLQRDLLIDVVGEYGFCDNISIRYVDYLGGTSLDFSYSPHIPTIPLPFFGASLVVDVNLRGQFAECRLCDEANQEIHAYAKGAVSLSLGVRWGKSVKDGINANGSYVYESGKYANGKSTYRDLAGRFAKAPSTDLLMELLELHLFEQDFVPATLADWDQLPWCPENSIKGTISAYVRGQASVLGFGSTMDFSWELLPNGLSIVPNFEGKRGFVGGGTALFVEIGAVGEINFTTVY